MHFDLEKFISKAGITLVIIDTSPNYGSANFPQFKRLQIPQVMAAVDKAADYVADSTRLVVAPSGSPLRYVALSERDPKRLHQQEMSRKVTCSNCLAYK